MEGFKVPEVPKEVEAAIKYALREVAVARPPNPIKFVAEKLREFAASMPAQTADYGGDGEAEEKQPPRRRSRARSRARRSVVFAPAVKLDEAWEPTIVPKSDEEKAAIREIMQKNILFNSLDGDSLTLLIDVMEKKTFSAGEDIITQGAQGDYYYVLQSGTTDIFKDGVLVLQCSKGMGFGELALMYDSPRAATVKATSDVVSWAIDRQSFKRVMMGTTTKRRDKYSEFLGGVDLLSSLTYAERLTIADALAPVEFKAGEDVVTEGDAVNTDRFYIVESGELKATKAAAEGEVCPRLKPGSYFGELALIKNEPRAATVTAVVPSRCLAMDRASFVRLLGPINDILARHADLYAKFEGQLQSQADADAEAAAALDALND